ncbi:MAG: hypothetical protein J0J01_30240 [Reyranella sp.]|uniref:hypothetical protein n=1 Tax=Reyranella sp. TaxID=1929291 RepID=UPI001ACB0C09|nr:hypothetical protein [Reyranella sp.]MBN9091219.1 hypothetical protein [Reyranella sp.]
MTGESNEAPGGRSCRAQLIERIGVLVGELEALSQRADQVPSSLVIEMRAMLENARRILEKCGQRPADRDEGDPQPDVDRDVLERMYRALAAGRSAKR